MGAGAGTRLEGSFFEREATGVGVLGSGIDSAGIRTPRTLLGRTDTDLRPPSDELEEEAASGSAVEVEAAGWGTGGLALWTVIVTGAAVDLERGGVWIEWMIRDVDDDLRGIIGRGAPAEFEFREDGWSFNEDILWECGRMVAIIRRLLCDALTGCKYNAYQNEQR